MPPSERQFWLVDAHGEIVASSEDEQEPMPEEQRKAILSDPQVRRAATTLRQRQGVREISIQIEGRGRPAETQALVAQVVRLDGQAGPLTLIEVRPRGSENQRPSRDSLTELPDRRAIAERAEAWRRAAAPAIPRFAALFLDLDQFKPINDAHGHAVGDAVLAHLASRWQTCVRDGDLVARYGGDEFVVLVQNAAEPRDVEPVIRRLQAAACEPIQVGDLALTTSVTIGWAIPEDDAWTIEGLIAAADRDMYAGKRSGVR